MTRKEFYNKLTTLGYGKFKLIDDTTVIRYITKSQEHLCPIEFVYRKITKKNSNYYKQFGVLDSVPRGERIGKALKLSEGDTELIMKAADINCAAFRKELEEVLGL